MDQLLIDLLNRVRMGSENDFSDLAERYRPLTESMTVKYAAMAGLKPGDSGWEDFRQNAGMALYRAAVTYDNAQTGVSFGLYAKICIRNALVSDVRSAKRLHRMDAGTRRESVREQKNHSEREPLSALVSSEEAKALYGRMISVLSAYEKKVFEPYIAGKSPREIAQMLGRHVKSVNNAVYRIKAKLKGLLR